MAKIVYMQGKGSFTKVVIKAAKNATKRAAKILMERTKKIINRKRKRKNLSGQSEYIVHTPSSISRKLRRKRGDKK